MNSENSKFPHPQKFLLNLTNKIDLGRDQKRLHYEILVSHTWKNIKKSHKTIQMKYSFIIKTGYYLELLIPKTMKLFGSTENKRT